MTKKVKHTATELKVYEMLTENTGRHMLDSGSAYGRHWERNQKVPIEIFKAQEPVYYRAKCYREGDLEMNVTKSLFHHLVDNLDYDKHYDDIFQRYIKLDDAKQELAGNGVRYWDEQMNDFDKLAKHNKRWDSGGYGWSERDGQDYDFDGYSYNEENILSQDFVYHMRGEFVLIQTHNGCDARGGFSAPVLFKQSGMSECGIIQFSQFTIACPNHHWDFESAGYYQTEGSDNTKWKDFEVADLDSYNAEEVNYDERLKQLKVERKAWELQLPLIGEDKPDFVPSNSEWGGLIIVKDEIAHCPLCGEELHTYSY